MELAGCSRGRESSRGRLSSSRGVVMEITWGRKQEAFRAAREKEKLSRTLGDGLVLVLSDQLSSRTNGFHDIFDDGKGGIDISGH